MKDVTKKFKLLKKNDYEKIKGIRIQQPNTSVY